MSDQITPKKSPQLFWPLRFPSFSLHIVSASKKKRSLEEIYRELSRNQANSADFFFSCQLPPDRRCEKIFIVREKRRKTEQAPKKAAHSRFSSLSSLLINKTRTKKIVSRVSSGRCKPIAFVLLFFCLKWLRNAWMFFFSLSQRIFPDPDSLRSLHPGYQLSHD